MYIYVYIKCKIWFSWNSAQYIRVERSIQCGRKNTNKLQVHSYKFTPTSLFRGCLLIRGFCVCVYMCVPQNLGYTLKVAQSCHATFFRSLQQSQVMVCWCRHWPLYSVSVPLRGKHSAVIWICIGRFAGLWLLWILWIRLQILRCSFELY